MISISTLKRFVAEQDGNAVIDWTVLMAGAVMMAIAVVLTVTDNIDGIAEGTSDRMENIEVNPNGSA